MKSRMDKYYDVDEKKARTSKNQELYHTIYDKAEYSNIEGIPVIEKNEKVDINMIKDLINKDNNIINKPKERVEIKSKEEVLEPFDDDKIYDIRDILTKAKDNRPVDDKKIFDTQYNILKNANLNDEFKTAKKEENVELHDMIDAISSNSKDHTTNLLDDLKSIYDPTMRTRIENTIANTMVTNQLKPIDNEIDKSFYTSTLGLKDNDFEDLQQIKDEVKQNNILTKVLILILLLVAIIGIVFLYYYFSGK